MASAVHWSYVRLELRKTGFPISCLPLPQHTAALPQLCTPGTAVAHWLDGCCGMSQGFTEKQGCHGISQSITQFCIELLRVTGHHRVYHSMPWRITEASHERHEMLKSAATWAVTKGCLKGATWLQ